MALELIPVDVMESKKRATLFAVLALWTFLGILPLAQAQSQAQSTSLQCLEVFPQEQQKQLQQAKHSSAIQTISGVPSLQDFLKEFENPYSLAYDVRREIEGSGASAEEKISELLQAFSSSTSAQDLSSKLNNWVQTESQALLVADMLMKLGLDRHREAAEHLLTHNVFFSDAHPIRGPPEAASPLSLVTFSFEKEGINPAITDFYRPPSVPESQWVSWPEEKRLEALKKLKVPLKTFLAPELISPTELKPSFLGGFSVELSTSEKSNWSWEVSHKKFEISRFRAMQQVKSLTSYFGETHSIHFHIVFELPKKYRNFKKLTRWHKHVNDYLYLRGLEEGLHGNELTNVVTDRRDLTLFERLKTKARSLVGIKTVLPNKLSQLSYQSAKFFSMGLRGGGLYGEASNSDNTKVGLELRDTTRSMSRLDEYTAQITKTVEIMGWENLKDEFVDESNRTPRLVTNHSAAKQLLSQAVPLKWAKYFHQIEPTTAIPFISFENAKYFNYQKSEFNEPSSDVLVRIKAARETYEKSLLALIAEIDAMRARGEKIDGADVKMALRMSLSEWGKNAMASELYRSF